MLKSELVQKIGKYDLLEKIGVGGFGEVFKGRDPLIKRLVAIKTCNSNDELIRERFFKEAEIAGNLHHRNVTTVYDFGLEDDLPYLVQEYLSGEDLDRKIKRGDFLPYPEKLYYLLQIARGLAYAHSRGVIHRDVKPGNVRILEDGTAKILDFGIAKLAQQETGLTQTGMTLGTAAYLAPEQIRGDPADHRTDVFAFGILAYELLAYERPFPGQQISVVIHQILDQEPRPLIEKWPAAPPELVAVIERCLDKDPARRFAHGGELQRALEDVQKQGRAGRGAATGRAATGRAATGRAATGRAAGAADGESGVHAAPPPAPPLESRDLRQAVTRELPVAGPEESSGAVLDDAGPAGRGPGSEPAPPDAAPPSAALRASGSFAARAGGARKPGRSRGLALAGLLLIVVAAVGGGWWIGTRVGGSPVADPAEDAVENGGDGARLDSPEVVANPAPGDAAAGAGAAAGESGSDPADGGADRPEVPQDGPGDPGEGVAEQAAAPPPEAVEPPPPPVPAVATLVLEPPGWTERMTAEVAGKTYTLVRPWEVELRPGAREITFSLQTEAYRRQETLSVDLAAGERKAVAAPIREPGAITVRPFPTRPQGVVWLDGKLLGRTPINGSRLPPGQHRIEIRPIDGSESSLEKELIIRSGQDTVLSFDLDSRRISEGSKPLSP